MDRPGIEAAINWANPELGHFESAGLTEAAAEPEVWLYHFISVYHLSLQCY
jgi:hypothetical protein